MIEIQDLTKTYGEERAVDGISFSVEQGEILGFLGPNGAGKTTTMKVLTGYLPPTAGRVRVDGLVDPSERRAIDRAVDDAIDRLAADDLPGSIDLQR